MSRRPDNYGSTPVDFSASGEFTTLEALSDVLLGIGLVPEALLLDFDRRLSDFILNFGSLLEQEPSSSNVRMPFLRNMSRCSEEALASERLARAAALTCDEHLSAYTVAITVLAAWTITDGIIQATQIVMTTLMKGQDKQQKI